MNQVMEDAGETLLGLLSGGAVLMMFALVLQYAAGF